MINPERISVEVRFPPKLKDLFRPHRYKVLYGGRGSSKSWSAARALLIQALERPMRVLCTREVQKSLKESVHQLLSDQIQELGLGKLYQVLETEIRAKNGSKFIFAGLSTQTAESIKSYEGCDRVWVEEGQTVSKRSWDILTPTIRRENSEIWVTFNPYLTTDETYQRFVLKPPPSAWVQEINYHDNPWFPQVLEIERMHAQATMPKEDYENIWEGKPLAAAAGSYYGDQIAKLRLAGHVREVPYQAGSPVHTYWDLGWNDSTAIWWHQYVASEHRFLRCYENSGESLEHYARVILDAGYVYGCHYLPHDAENKSLQTGKSVLDILSDLLPGHRFEIVPRVENVLSGIQATRLRLMGPVYFDAQGCDLGLTALERYRKEWDEKRQVFKDRPLHDQYSNLADSFRQWGQGFDTPSAKRQSKRKSRQASWRAV